MNFAKSASHDPRIISNSDSTLALSDVERELYATSLSASPRAPPHADSGADLSQDPSSLTSSSDDISSRPPPPSSATISKKNFDKKQDIAAGGNGGSLYVDTAPFDNLKLTLNKYDSIETIRSSVNKLRDEFETGKSLPNEWRAAVLRKIIAMMKV